MKHRQFGITVRHSSDWRKEGGLDWTEALAILNDKTWKEMGYRFHLQEGEMEKAKEAVLAYIKERSCSPLALLWP